MRRFLAFLSLFTSVGTLFCCALPALFVVLGFGAAFAGLVGNFPQLIWLSEHKVPLFLVGATVLILGGVLQWRARRNLECPADLDLSKSCASTRDWSHTLYFVSVTIYLVGALFAFVAEKFGETFS